MIRKLGAERYGIWALIFTVVDYFWFFDLGLNTAITNFCARYWAAAEIEKINEVINTALFYFSAISLIVMALTIGLADNLRAFFRVPAAYQADFSSLIQLTGVSWALCIVMNLFVSALQGFQRFDLENRVWVASLALRSAGYFLALSRGYGLVVMAAIYVLSQLLAYVFQVRNFRGVFKELRLSAKLVKLSVFGEIAS